jgi:hypothetical protein
LYPPPTPFHRRRLRSQPSSRTVPRLALT